MSTLSLRLPKSLHEQLKELAQEVVISVKEFVILAVAEKLLPFQRLNIWKNAPNAVAVKSCWRF
jgi:hypothetical protein